MFPFICRRDLMSGVYSSINQSINQSRNHSCTLSFLCAVERNLTFGKWSLFIQKSLFEFCHFNPNLWGNIQEIGKRTTNTSSLEGRELGKMYQSVWLFYAIYRWQTQTEEFTERPFSQACEVCYCLIFEFIKFHFPRLRWFLNSGKISRKSGSSFRLFYFYLIVMISVLFFRDNLIFYTTQQICFLPSVNCFSLGLLVEKNTIKLP